MTMEADESYGTLRIATFLDGHMMGRQLAITADQDRLTFKKLEKPFLEAPPNLVTVDYRKVSETEDTKEYQFMTVEGIIEGQILDDANG